MSFNEMKRTYLFNARSRTNLAPNASNWKLAWARWTACKGRKRVLTADDGSFVKHLQYSTQITDVADARQMVNIRWEHWKKGFLPCGHTGIVPVFKHIKLIC